jgi:arginase
MTQTICPYLGYYNLLNEQAKEGVDSGPAAVIESGILDKLKQDLGLSISFDNKVHNYSDVIPQDDPPFHNMNRPRTVSAATKKLSSQVYEHVSQGRRVLTLGGDDSIGIGTVSGVAKAIRDRFDRDLAVIWVDAHGDINTPESSRSGNIHGMPLAFVTGLASEEPADIFGWLQKDHLISTRRLIYIGLRDLDEDEKESLENNHIKAFFMEDVDRCVLLHLYCS